MIGVTGLCSHGFALNGNDGAVILTALVSTYWRLLSKRKFSGYGSLGNAASSKQEFV
ncbi:hypothetical protein [Ruegeria atlantica]|uniref:hypothetical protein n=1 Tax=Ruegeria atlantica TaxID=81569 RepID=UPI0014810180|nr:hypothetical protein [Ruegeria atlantica]